MSALGQKQTFAVQKGMSALTPIATAKADFRKRSCLLYPRKQHQMRQVECPLRAKSGHSACLLDHFVGTRKHRQRHGEAQRLGSLEIDDQLVLGRSLYRQISWLLTLEDTIDVSGRPAELCENVIPIRDQAAAGRKGTTIVDRRQFVPGRKRNYQALMHHRQCTGRQDQTAIRRVREFGEFALDFTGIVDAYRTQFYSK